MRPGASVAELGEQLRARFPQDYFPDHYPFIAHGVGMCDEYPAIKWDTHHDGELEANMCLSVEAYCTDAHAVEGVKLEEQIIVTDAGPEIISRSAAHDELLLG
jgi:Xaa-Pro aminopeptidase